MALALMQQRGRAKVPWLAARCPCGHPAAQRPTRLLRVTLSGPERRSRASATEYSLRPSLAEIPLLLTIQAPRAAAEQPASRVPALARAGVAAQVARLRGRSRRPADHGVCTSHLLRTAYYLLQLTALPAAHSDYYRYASRYAGDAIGRRRAMALTNLLTVLGALGSALLTWGDAATVYSVLMACRFVLGVGVGGKYPLAATIRAEACSEGDTPRHSATEVAKGFFWQTCAT